MTAPDLRTAAMAVSTTWDATWGKVGVAELENTMAPLIDTLRDATLAAEATEPPPDDRPGLIGRDDKLTETLADILHEQAAKRFDHSPVRDMHRGRWFELRGEDGHVWRVDVTLDRREGTDA